MADKVFLSTTEIYNFYKEHTFTAHAAIRENSQDYNAVLKDLKTLWRGLKDKEQQVYDSLDLDTKDVHGLQKKFDALNHSGLKSFANDYYLKYIENNPYINKALQWANESSRNYIAIIRDYALERIDTKVLTYLKENDQDPYAVGGYISGAMRALEVSLRELWGTKSFDRRGKYVEHFKQYMRRYIKEKDAKLTQTLETDLKQNTREIEAEISALQKNPKFLNQAVIKIKKEYHIDDSPIYKSTIDMPLKEKNFTNSTQQLVYYYPYIGPKDFYDELVDDLDNWDRFVQHIQTVASSSLISSSLIRNIMETVGPRYFCVSNMAGLKGKLGELQAALIMGAIFGEKNIEITGHWKNEYKANKAELGADIILNNEFGIQVKNYHANSEDKNAYSSFQKDVTVKEVLQRIRKNGASIDAENLETVLGMMAFNQPADNAEEYISSITDKINPNSVTDFRKKYAEYLGFYNRNLKEHATGQRTRSTSIFIRSILAHNLNSFFTLDENYKSFVGPEDEKVIKEGSYTNVFYLMGGKTLIPTSRIIAKIIKNLQMIITMFAADHGDREQFYHFGYNFDPSKSPQKWSYSLAWGDSFAPNPPNISNAPSVLSVIGSMNLNINLQIYVSSLLNDDLDNIKI